MNRVSPKCFGFNYIQLGSRVSLKKISFGSWLHTSMMEIGCPQNSNLFKVAIIYNIGNRAYQNSKIIFCLIYICRLKMPVKQ